MFSDTQHRALAAAGISIALLTSGPGVPPVQAECVLFRDVCTEFEHRSIVLLADVIEVSSDGEFETVRLRVVEAFKGLPADQQELTARISIRFAEEIRLKVGRYLIYAQSTVDGRLSLSTCSRTKPVNAKDETEVQQLRQCAVKK